MQQTSVQNELEEKHPPSPNREGYWALVFLLAFHVNQCLGWSMGIYGMIPFFLFLVLAWLFAIGGERRSTGFARKAAGVALILLILESLAVLRMAYH